MCIRDSAKAQADGLQGKARRDAVTAAMKLTDEQEKARQKLQKLQMDVRKQVIALLSPEQIEKAGLQANRERGKKRKKGDG
jgi:flagellar basal body-associated protein FliL